MPRRVRNAALLGPAAEEVRVAALEPDDGLPPGRQVGEQLVGFVLRQLVVAGTFAHVDALGLGGGFGEQHGVGQGVVDHDVRPAEAAESGNGDQARIAGPGSD